MRYTAIALLAIGLLTGNALTAPAPQPGGAVGTDNTISNQIKRQNSGVTHQGDTSGGQSIHHGNGGGNGGSNGGPG
ncbi:hypothetical protein LZ31DRAFT_601237 [Colletotrichum somersetense]|nr:hypothetical protein LZ31DRAFT_601237 [Colletotrichum somersetense]